MTMIEKMARAMAVDDSGPEGSQIFDIHWAEFGNGYKSSARAALEALLEPSEGMLTAGMIAPNYLEDQSSKRGCKNIFAAMIQAALEEK